MKNIIWIILTICTSLVFAGTEWQAITTVKSDGTESITMIKAYAQDGSIREDFTEVKNNSGLSKKGAYFIYSSKSATVLYADPQEKVYMEMALDDLLAGMNGLMTMTITNPKVSVKQLESQTINGMLCNHYLMTANYDMEMKMMFMTTNSRIETETELWGTKEISMNDLSKLYMEKGLKTPFKELNQLIEKQASVYSQLGFIIQSVTKQKTTDKNDPKKISTSTTTMKVDKIAKKTLSPDLFVVPKDYKKQEMKMPNVEDNNKKDGNKNKPAKTEEIKDDKKKEDNLIPDFIKKLF